MNYRHIYHAGNFADVFKHSILTLLMQALCQKDKPCVFIDSHAGVGLYSLRDYRSKKTNEANEGIGVLLKESNPIIELKSYLQLIKQYINEERNMYPGSPLIMQSYQRADDHIILNELHDEDFHYLKQNFKNTSNTHLHQRDAYELLSAILPPMPRRGLILIDPPFEKKNEFSRISDTLEKCLKKFSTGVYCFWYPIVDSSNSKHVKKIIKNFQVETLHAEICIDDVYRVNQGLVGCGMVIVNPPWKINQKVYHVAKYLVELFAKSENAKATVQLHNRDIMEN